MPYQFDHPMRGCTDLDCGHEKMRAIARRNQANRRRNRVESPKLSTVARIEQAIAKRPEITNSQLMDLGFAYHEIRHVRARVDA